MDFAAITCQVVRYLETMQSLLARRATCSMDFCSHGFFPLGERPVLAQDPHILLVPDRPALAQSMGHLTTPPARPQKRRSIPTSAAGNLTHKDRNTARKAKQPRRAPSPRFSSIIARQAEGRGRALYVRTNLQA